MSLKFLKLMQRSQARRSLTPEQARFLNAETVDSWLAQSGKNDPGTEFNELLAVTGAALYAATAEIDPVEAPQNHSTADALARELIEKLGDNGIQSLSQDRAKQTLLEAVDAFDGLLSEIDPGVYPNIAAVGRHVVLHGDKALGKSFVDYAHGRNAMPGSRPSIDVLPVIEQKPARKVRSLSAR